MGDTTNGESIEFPDRVTETSTTYETMLDQDSRWAMDEGSRHFEEKSAVHETLKKICGRLDELDIPYAVVGGMALFRYGYRRFTDDVDILVSKESLAKIHAELDGLGYRPPFSGSKHLRDTEFKVKIEFLISGEFPGDGKPKDVAFPNPIDVGEVENGINYLNLKSLVELKLASGMTGQDRMKDLVDVQELISLLHLPQSFADDLAPYVRDKFSDLWQAANGSKTKYMLLWRNKFLTNDAKNLDDVSEKLQSAAELLRKMKADGVQMDSSSNATDDYIYLVTTDPDVARKYDMHDERDFLGREAEE